MEVDDIVPGDYPELIQIWEASVRATHDFLSVEDILFLKPLILEQYIDAVDLHCVKSVSDKIVGFVGVAEDNIEMLFISPEYLGKGIGTLLTKFAIEKQRGNKVDVKEQNPKAVGLYEHVGFEVVGRSALDGQGRPFPLLHMVLNEQ